MIFSSQWAYFNDSGSQSPSLIPCNVFNMVICVYQGVQPSMAEYIENYNSSYNLSSPDILQAITNYNGSANYNDSGGSFFETNPDGEFYTQGLKSIRSGTATWAAVISITEEFAGWLEPNPDGYYFLSDEQVAFLNNQIYESINNGVLRPINPGLGQGLASIVPVSDMTGTGVIKFRSIEFTDPDETDENRAIDMSVTISMVNQE
jgi:hypothetical protein